MQDPVARLNIGGNEFEARRDNTSLFTHIGEDALYDHVFINYEDNETSTGLYIFSFHDGYKALKRYVIKNRYPLHMNIQGAAECDKKAFDKAISQMTQDTDFVPEAWYGNQPE